MLPAGSPEPGPWRSSRTPYTIEPGEAAVSGRYRRVLVCMMAQGGKTQGFFNVIGQVLDDRPAPILFVGPSKSNITGVIEPKVDQMLRSSDSLWSKTLKGKKYSQYKKVVSGVVLRFAWAGSTTEVKSDSAAIVIVDEIDEAPADVGGQGDIITLSDARHSAYIDGITLGASTPTIGHVETEYDEKTRLERWAISDEVESLIWRYWQQGTRHEWAWPCPDCGEYFIPRLRLLWWPDGATAKEAEKQARLVCPHCGSQIESKHKDSMNSRGRFVAPGQSITVDGMVHGEPPDVTDATYWVSGIANFSTKKTFGFLASQYVKAAKSGDDAQIKACKNTEFGECFAIRGEAPEWTEVRALAQRSHYINGQVPSGMVCLIAGVDVQKNRLVYVVRAFGDAFSSALVEFGELWGDTDQPFVWQQLADLLEKQYGDDVMPISKMVIDSGYRTDEVYNFCRKHRRAVPSKGHDTLSKPYYAALVDVNVRGRLLKNGIQLWHYDADVGKSWVHARVDWPEDQPGTWLLPTDISEDYCKQLVAEQRVSTPTGAMWLQTKSDNHFLDCESLCYLGIRINGIRRMSGAQKPTQQPKPIPPPKPPPGRPPGGGQYSGRNPFARRDI